MTKTQNTELPPEAGQPNPHSSLDCYQLTLLAIPLSQYIVVADIFFAHPPLPEVWPNSQNLWSQKLTIFGPHIA